ncbi:carbohydrate kinase family protein [Mucilaginibacter paludis]|uniref:PfkB domain protein n=1 Tax=Mucilaginibacter paludis DSM 18603 TaxID=714943 RepID=H1Y240_9SPHI|nr:carbohydrate kinase [Mucilaginibacter paludis]EHQ26697.1 PfkB domain protein [Mucilaginibacter paludis DSM 18603]
MKKQVLCYGEVLWDTFGTEKKAGGAPMNVALHLVQQGIAALPVSRLGNDASGNKLVEFLKANKLYSDLIQTDEKLPTCEVTVKLDENQQATYTIPQPVSWDNIRDEAPLLEKIRKTNVIVFGSLACRTETSRNTLLNLFENRLLKIFDVNLRPPHYQLSTIETLAAMADVIKMNEEEANLLIGAYDEPLKDKIIEFQRKFHCQTICVTRGENGAMIWHNEKFYEHPGYTVKVEDTVGAGDAFLATFIAGLLNKHPMDKVLEKACAIGAFVTSRRGANPVYDEAEISEIINKQESIIPLN